MGRGTGALPDAPALDGRAGALLTLSLAYGLLPCVLKLLAGLALYLGLMRGQEPHPASQSL